MPLIYADLMKCDLQNRLVLTCRGTFEHLKKHGIDLEPGLRLVFYNEDENSDGERDDLVVEGVIDYDRAAERWVANIDWDAIRNISQLTPAECEHLGISI